MRSVTLKSAITPSFIGLMATMFPGGGPNISFASLPTASTSPVGLLMATIEGSFTTMPLPFAYTSVLAVPRSMARSLENALKIERRLWTRPLLEWKPLPDMMWSLFSLLVVLGSCCPGSSAQLGALLLVLLLLFDCSGERRRPEGRALHLIVVRIEAGYRVALSLVGNCFRATG